MNKPFSESCEQNRDPILSVIQPLLSNCTNVLEIGSGTGQHAVYFAEKMPHLLWQTSDCAEYLPGITLWLDEAGLEISSSPIELDVSNSVWPTNNVDTIFTANSVHIMSWKNVQDLFNGVGQLLKRNGQFIVYGPFNYDNQYTSESNARFDDWLGSRNTESSIKNFEDVCQLAEQNGMFLVKDYEMPVNNRILHWIKH